MIVHDQRQCGALQCDMRCLCWRATPAHVCAWGVSYAAWRTCVRMSLALPKWPTFVIAQALATFGICTSTAPLCVPSMVTHVHLALPPSSQAMLSAYDDVCRSASTIESPSLAPLCAMTLCRLAAQSCLTRAHLAHNAALILSWLGAADLQHNWKKSARCPYAASSSAMRCMTPQLQGWLPWPYALLSDTFYVT